MVTFSVVVVDVVTVDAALTVELLRLARDKLLHGIRNDIFDVQLHTALCRIVWNVTCS